MFVVGRQVLLRISIKRSFAPWAAKIIGLPIVFRFRSSTLGVNIHPTNRVFCHYYLLVIKFQNLPSQEATLEWFHLPVIDSSYPLAKGWFDHHAHAQQSLQVVLSGYAPAKQPSDRCNRSYHDMGKDNPLAPCAQHSNRTFAQLENNEPWAFVLSKQQSSRQVGAKSIWKSGYSSGLYPVPTSIGFRDRELQRHTPRFYIGNLAYVSHYQPKQIS